MSIALIFAIIIISLGALLFFMMGAILISDGEFIGAVLLFIFSGILLLLITLIFDSRKDEFMKYNSGICEMTPKKFEYSPSRDYNDFDRWYEIKSKCYAFAIPLGR